MAPTLFCRRALSLLAWFTFAQAIPYRLSESFNGETFFDNFNFVTSDPSGGWVSYVDQATAQSLGYASTSTGAAHLGVDSTSVLSPSGAGRRSVRIESKNAYTRGLFIGDFNHMPFGCGLWPAFWMYGPNWPTSGEIDIIEGVNLQTVNQVSGHTSAGCSISGANAAAAFISDDCYDPVANSGCSFRARGAYTYGQNFNAVGGGVYAMQWTENWISVWFFRRGAIPADVANGNPDPATWPRPMAQFAGADANIAERFADMKIVVNTDFCGPWASGVWSKCPMDTCVDYVAATPGAFADAYWSINSIRVYQPPPTAQTAAFFALPDSQHGHGNVTGTGHAAEPLSTLSAVVPLDSVSSVVPVLGAMGATESPSIGPTAVSGVSVSAVTSLKSNPPTGTGAAEMRRMLATNLVAQGVTRTRARARARARGVRAEATVSP